ncbi:hypothetical protein B4168_1753 [Anoxybacillus flavithermus]|nr:hypothetical protein B4168_1753 [Anoxybacillus flavithermus]OAO84768.1 hypothetical protein GT23_3373 [Parageobacillus thermoglucosidasius]
MSCKKRTTSLNRLTDAQLNGSLLEKDSVTMRWDESADGISKRKQARAASSFCGKSAP